MHSISRTSSPQPHHALAHTPAEARAGQPASSRAVRSRSLGGVEFYVQPQIRGTGGAERGSRIELALRQMEAQPARFSIESTPQHGGGEILTCTPRAESMRAAAPFVKLCINQHRYLVQAEVSYPVERDRYGNGTRLRTTVVEFDVPSTPAPAASAQVRAPAWTAALQVPAQHENMGKERGRPLSSPISPMSLGHARSKRRVDDHGVASSSTVSRNCVESFHADIPSDWPDEVRKAALLIPHFERQVKKSCLQHAYNNAMGAPLFQLSSDLAAQGADIGLVCSEEHGAPQPLRRLELNHGQLSALIPALAEHLSEMIIFRGNPRSGEGHYEALRRIGNHVFLLDSLQMAPQWLPDPECYFRERLDNPGMLIAAMPPGAPVLERYVDFLSRNVWTDVARGLGDVYGEQPIVSLEEYFTSQGIEKPGPAQLAAYFHWRGVPAQFHEWVFDDMLTLRNIGVTLGTAGNGQQSVLLMTHTHPFLIPAYFSTEQGAWKACVPDADGSGTQTRPLQAVLDAQQGEYDKQHEQAGTDARRQEIDLQRRSLGAVWLQDWPLNWPPVSAPAPSKAETNVLEKARTKSGKRVTSRKQTENVSCPWEPGKTYSVTGVVPPDFSDVMFRNRWRAQEIIQHGITQTFDGLIELSAACDKVPGQHLGEGVFVHDGVQLPSRAGVPKVKVYRKLRHDNKVVDIGIPIVGEVNLRNFDTKRARSQRKTRDAGPSDATIHFNTDSLVRERMFAPVKILYPLMGSKRDIVELEPSGAVLGALHAALNAPEVGSVVDAFAGTGFLTLWIAAQQRRGFAKQNLRLVMNELDQYRHNTLKTVQQHPEHVKQALGDLMQQIKHLYYRTFHNHPIADMVNGRDDRKFDEALARRLAAQAGLSVPSMTTEQLLALLNKTVEDWVGTAVIDVSTNAKFSTALKDYIVGHIDCPLPPAPENPGADDIRQRARNAAIYLLAQHNGHMPSNPINFSRSVGSRPNQHPSGILVGSKGSIQSRMLVSATILNKARREAKDTSRVTKLSMDLNFRPDSGGKDTMFHNLPLHIDQVSDALTGVDIQRGDGWELLHSLRKDAFALIDPPYWADKKKSASLKVYNNGSRDDFSKARFLNMVDQIVMPAWKEGARMIMFNRLDDDIAHEMKSRGFDVTALLNINRMSRDNSNLTEFMAVNFNIDSNATLRPFIAHPSPAAPLAAPADASSEDESDKSDETP